MAIPSIIEPPVYDPPLTDHGDGQRHSHAWTDFYQRITDSIYTIQTTTHNGATDGSDALPGVIGEYLTASGSVGLSNSVVTAVASMTLTPGDWDVSGGVTFTITTAASNRYGVGIDGALSNEIIATIPTGSGIWRLGAVTVRRNISVNTAVSLSALAGFVSGVVSVSGVISARRMR
jgi:hypothetical protein